ncbi:ABC transporter ATP-binding protein [Candidatus Pelagibacter ubique]|jgi:glycerol transport system ATP-binding protein|nr:ABC transporter ATP-binding protein [Candidatus Pelagibacter ubique]MDA7453657.1 ABC transporter ATP-binding protein [Candidatus Pelagibacter ubique]MDA7478916.1 ABC transporter ATP-binding protein [Candidatus Pelagibacter ubique]MDA9158376.1 ABC transporter ATP-binding protein [Candidatus Pelagibacter ubique]MDB9751279.1 ABC transporter ATP-binding protein [Candidatus Pelagibacter ubique]
MSLELKNVEKKVGTETHIYSTNLKLEKNTINVLLGSTLAGKTTLMQIMAGLDKPTSGEIWFNDENVTGKAVQKRNCSMVYQQFINYPNFTVFENIASPLKITGVKTDEIKERVGKVAELLKLSAMLNKKPDELSGGQQQRTALARALVKDSDLILLDEPLANLDFKLREELREELPKLFEDRDCIVVYATTEPLDALMIGGNTATLLEGNVIQYGKTLNVYKKPENLTSAKVFSDPPMNIAEISKSGEMIKLKDNNVQWKSNVQIKDGNYKIGIRPHNITTYREGDNSVEINGKVLISELSGSESLIHFTIGKLSWVSLSNGIQQKNIGENTKLFMNVDEFLYFDTNNRLVTNG